MKRDYNFIILLLLSVVFAGCEYDNYEAPKSMLQGRIVYNGEPIQVSTNEVNIELWEPGWQLKNRIDVAVAQEGTYSASLFDADYKLMFRQNQGPFRMKFNTETNSDTILVNVRGNTVRDIEVLPYYMIRNPQITMTSGVITATASLEKIITDENARDVERVSLYLNRTKFVDQRGEYNLARTDIAAADIPDLNSVSLSVTVPELVRSQSFVYARIGVKMQGVEHLIYSPVQQLTL